MYVTGYRVSLLVAGAGALVIADYFSWRLAFIILASFFPLGIVIILMCNIKEKNSEVINKKEPIRFILYNRVINPFIDFMKNHNWILILIFIALFKWGDALLGVLSQPFMLEIGFTKSEIADEFYDKEIYSLDSKSQKWNTKFNPDNYKAKNFSEEVIDFKTGKAVIKLGEKINYLNAKKLSNDGLKDILVSKESLYGKFLHKSVKVNEEEGGTFQIGTELNDTIINKILEAKVEI